MKAQFVKDIRAFNRFYTNILGLLDKHILDSNYSLPEVRIMYELYHNSQLTASGLISSLGIDKGYLSRILRNFENNNLVSKLGSKHDKRATVLQLTAKGKKEFMILNGASELQIQNIFESLSENDCKLLVQKMKAIQEIISKVK